MKLTKFILLTIIITLIASDAMTASINRKKKLRSKTRKKNILESILRKGILSLNQLIKLEISKNESNDKSNDNIAVGCTKKDGIYNTLYNSSESSTIPITVERGNLINVEYYYLNKKISKEKPDKEKIDINLIKKNLDILKDWESNNQTFLNDFKVLNFAGQETIVMILEKLKNVAIKQDSKELIDKNIPKQIMVIRIKDIMKNDFEKSIEELENELNSLGKQDELIDFVNNWICKTFNKVIENMIFKSALFILDEKISEKTCTNSEISYEEAIKDKIDPENFLYVLTLKENFGNIENKKLIAVETINATFKLDTKHHFGAFIDSRKEYKCNAKVPNYEGMLNKLLTNENHTMIHVTKLNLK